MTDDPETIRLNIHPEPDDEELLAILQALRVFQTNQSDNRTPDDNDTSRWRTEGRLHEQRARYWPLQEQNWVRRS